MRYEREVSTNSIAYRKGVILSFGNTTFARHTVSPTGETEVGISAAIFISGPLETTVVH